MIGLLAVALVGADTVVPPAVAISQVAVLLAGVLLTAAASAPVGKKGALSVYLLL